MGRVEPCRLIDLPEHKDPRGSLAVVESNRDVKFDINRVYYLYDLPSSTVRGAHGHRSLEQLIIAVHGRFEITVDDGYRRMRFQLDSPTKALYVGPMIWRDLINFSPGAVGLVIASMHYDESDYFREYSDFLEAARSLE
ncbi:FdtA/QdtA family cupin domain-containing protein [Allokutzneria sp. A3M-2-11 16]|uniref:sugar 3,4-ketoisomerase n=1 Tax=Allokutzneria sp. A3M-2-11 16 TaxID=2962043 RepID=UPI0020B7C40A|nr:FdtA/QdtA family cupin domain-containing protein [Allokutzneria sp. A3M-2-11 16]MCP3804663.1 FdtA/QdtA family cupin domain-containing protein [Allokutzneria sp. A3M-2-11 16]